VKDLQREFPKAQVLEVAGAAHPVPFNAMVNQFVLQALHRPAATTANSEPVCEAPVQQALQMPMPFDTPAVSPQQTTPSRVGLLGLLKRLLGATKK
jgi:hypothetical protein